MIFVWLFSPFCVHCFYFSSLWFGSFSFGCQFHQAFLRQTDISAGGSSPQRERVAVKNFFSGLKKKKKTPQGCKHKLLQRGTSEPWDQLSGSTWDHFSCGSLCLHRLDLDLRRDTARPVSSPDHQWILVGVFFVFCFLFYVFCVWSKFFGQSVLKLDIKMCRNHWRRELKCPNVFESTSVCFLSTFSARTLIFLSFCAFFEFKSSFLVSFVRFIFANVSSPTKTLG